MELERNLQFPYLPEAVVCHAVCNVRMDKEGLKIVELLTFQGKVLSFSREYYIRGRKSAVEHIHQLKNRMSGKLMEKRENDKNNSE